MNIKTTFVLAILAAGAAVLWWYGGPQLPPALDPSAHPAPVKDEGSRAFLDSLQKDKIARIDVFAPLGETRLTRKPDGSWSLPGNWPIRESEVRTLMDLLAGLYTRFQPQPIANADRLAELHKVDGPQPTEREKILHAAGMDEPTVIVELTLDGQNHSLLFAEERQTAGGDRFARDTYLHLDDKPEVLRLAPGILAALNKSTDYYQQRRLFQFERVTKEGELEKAEKLVRNVTIEDKKPNGSHFTLDHRGKDWELAEPVRDRLDSTSRDALLAAVPDLWAERFNVTAFLLPAPVFDNPASLATDLFFATRDGLRLREGLTNAERVVTVKYTNGDTVTLEIGNVSAKRTKMVQMPQQPGMPPGMAQGKMPMTEEYRFAKLRENDRVFEIRADKLKDVFVSLETLREAKIADFKTADARRVEIQHDGEDILLEKEKENWKIVKPLAAEADNSKVTELLTKLTDLQARDKDIIDKEDPKKYGLDKPAAVVKITVEEASGDASAPRVDLASAPRDETKDKKTRTLTVRVGKHDKDKKKLYVMADDWPRINLVDDALDPLVQRSALAYRGKRLFDFTSADVAKLAIDNRGQKFALEHDKGVWRLAGPAKAEADSLKVDQLADNLGKLEVLEYVDQTPKKDDLGAKYGLEKSPLSVRIEFTDKKKSPRVIHLGKARGGKDGYFAQLADAKDKSSPVFAVSADIHKELTRDSLSYRPLKLWQIFPEEIDALNIRKAGQKEYSLTRSGIGWKISGPFEANALDDAVQKMTAELGSPKIERYTAHEAKDLSKYGLDKPALRVEVKTKVGRDPKESAAARVLLIGKTVDKDSTSRYAKREGDSAIFQVSNALVVATDRGPLDLLDTTLLRLDAASLANMHVQFTDSSLTLEKKGDAWRVKESPAGDFPIDAEASDSLGSLWANLRAERFADYGTSVDWSKYGLDKPGVRVALKAKASGTAAPEHTVELGNEVAAAPGARYVRVDKGPGVAVLSPRLTRRLERNYLDYVDRNILKFDGGAVVSLQRHMGSKVLEVAKKDDAWQVVKPTEEKADDKGMQDLLGQLGGLRAERIAAFPIKDRKKFGLDSPSAILTVKLSGERKPTEHLLKLGKTTGKDGERYALVDDNPAVAVLPAALVEQLMGSPLTFRDRTIARFGDADRLRLERGPRTAVFRKIDGTWKLTEPLQAEAEQDALDDFLGSLARLRADALVAQAKDAAALKKYGLDRPAARWRLHAGDKEVLDLRIGNPEARGQRRYAKLANRDLVFLLDPRLSGKVLDEYRPRTVWTPPLDAVEIESLNYRYPRRPFTLEKSGSAWQALGKPDAKINTATVEDTLAALAGLKLSRYAVDKGANLALFGLDKPTLILEAATRSGKRILHLGNTEGDSQRRYARVADTERSDVFVLDEATCARLLRDLPAFGKPPATAPAPPRAAR